MEKRKHRPLSFKEMRPDPAARRVKLLHHRKGLHLLLDHVKDPRNIGAMIRLADAACLGSIWLLQAPEGILQHRLLKKVARSAMACLPVYEIQHIDQIAELGWEAPLWGLEITDHSIPYMEAHLPNPSMLAAGNEQRGLSEAVLRQLKGCIHVPLYGMNSSMNVAMAAGIAVYGLLHPCPSQENDPPARNR